MNSLTGEVFLCRYCSTSVFFVRFFGPKVLERAVDTSVVKRGSVNERAESVQTTIFYEKMAPSKPSFYLLALWLKLFITEFLILLRETCGAETDHFDSEHYGREREAFGSTIMGWRSAHTA
jgi:hypothetical protein